MPFVAAVIDCFNPSGKPVSRTKYLLVGGLLMLFKYLVEAVMIHQTTGQDYSFIDFINPSLMARNVFLAEGPEWLGFAWLLWTLPFVWSALVLSIRRMIDAGRLPWNGLFVLVPFLNWPFMLVASCLGTRSQTSSSPLAEQASMALNSSSEFGKEHSKFAAFLNAILVAIVYAATVMAFSIYLLGDYGVVVFMGSPFVAGATSGYLLARSGHTKWSIIIGHATGLVFTLFGLLLLFGFEGAICLVMALPIFLPMTIFGSVIGLTIAMVPEISSQKKDQGMLGALLFLPLIGVAETQLVELPEKMVESSLVIDASPQAVWDTVIAFPPIESEPPWYFRYGIASPKSAYIEGEGVGAIRYCQFTTGDFVEPITVWDEPNHLAFDVTSQPDPMTEMTPYREIRPPHLHGTLKSKRGEFVLVPISETQTKLIGRTWYEIDMKPMGYWTAWTNWLLHRIHYRVLGHIKVSAEER